MVYTKFPKKVGGWGRNITTGGEISQECSAHSALQLCSNNLIGVWAPHMTYKGGEPFRSEQTGASRWGLRVQGGQIIPPTEGGLGPFLNSMNGVLGCQPI